ncbi:MAG: DUF190 domain-containing protein [Sphingopyxis sp.]|jgi:hypothetical protein|uniref:DUF190 domain-containing protein n=1 Tax=unclassified Sphingopyxis TaxID=2614943 RepID=UPI001A486557|nr:MULTISPECIES: DUF190 domain-containing protein [unclassified Sphingopyxis]MBL9070700.1 DUF190 domain-containing protein [Sphingopyxis sp.]MBN8805305.1 DUF190 domain-containing protein [Sphingopyxis terrae]HEV7340744.1 DUF190 domain-containing protein [Sphingopyxis sp.]
MEDKDYALLRIYTDEMAVSGDKALFEVILEKAKAHKLLGVTVLRGRVGFGHSNLVHATSFLDHNYPLIVEIVDMPATLRNFAAQLHQLKGIGAMTLLPVELL